MARRPTHLPRKTAEGRLSAEGRAQIGGRIRELRGNRALEDVAAAAGISGGTLGAIERGETDPRLGTLLRLLAALGIGTVEQLIGPLPAAILAARERDAACTPATR